MTEKYDLQIIVPVYNVKNFLRECIESILNQVTIYHYLLILVDDGSSDGSQYIVDEYENHDNIRVIHQDNKGLSGARNTGLREICAKYIMFVDSDDRLRKNAIDNLLNVAFSNNADIVQGGYIGFRKGLYTQSVGYPRTEEVHYSQLQGFAWAKVYKSTLFSSVVFPERYLFEDTVNPFIVFPQSHSNWVIDKIVYEYRSNPMGINLSSSKAPRVLDTFWITKKMILDRSVIGCPIDIYYLRRMWRQFFINANRLQNSPQDIQMLVFYASSDIYANVYNSGDVKITGYPDVEIHNILINKDYYGFLCAVKWVTI